MSTKRSYDVIHSEGGVPIKAWTRGVPIEEAAAKQLANVARMPFIHQWVAAMPDVHWGIGATVGSVIPTIGAIIPAAVGVDIGCGMMAVRTTLTASDLPESLRGVRAAIEAAVPHGRTPRGRDKGAWSTPPPAAAAAWAGLAPRFDAIIARHPAAGGAVLGIPSFRAEMEAVNCHHNYVAREHHYGKDVLLTRKGAVRAREGDLGIIPGSMGARSYIVRGKGNPESFHSCSHGAGRAMSRAEAKRRFTLEDHAHATAGIECRKDADVLDETPGAYKSIDAVMEAQKDLVEVVHTLRQVVCVKG